MWYAYCHVFDPRMYVPALRPATPQSISLSIYSISMLCIFDSISIYYIL